MRLSTGRGEVVVDDRAMAEPNIKHQNVIAEVERYRSDLLGVPPPITRTD
jgi:hypothetical protein